MPNPIGRALRSRRAGQHTLAWARSELQAPENFALTSPAFEHGQPIPEKYKGRIFAPNISPALEWTAPPKGTVELVLIAQDPDVPFGTSATHVLAIGIDPTLGRLPEGALRDPSPVAEIRYGKGPIGRRGWAGPMPVPSHGPHFYVFQLYALDTKVELPKTFTLDQAIAAMAAHVLGRARLDGTYENP